MMSKNLNGIQRAAEIVDLFSGWVEDRHAEQDVLMWTNARGHLNKDMIRKELGFSRDSFRTNPELSEAFAIAEETLLGSGDPSQRTKAAREANSRADRAVSDKQISQAEVNRLKEQNISMAAENRRLKYKLAKLERREEATSGFAALAEQLSLIDD